MIVKTFAWNFDPHATDSANFIKGERQTLTASNGPNFRVLIPRGAPFYAKDLKVTFVPLNRELRENIDYQLAYQFELLTRKTFRPVFAGIVILDSTLSGTFEIDYRTVGGEFTLDQATLATLLSNAITDPRSTSWEALTEVPWYMTPIEHRFDVADMVGMSDVVDGIDRLTAAVSERGNANALLIEHIGNDLNPHNVTKEQIGLSLVPNCRMATEQEALDMARTDLFVSPAHIAIVLARLNSESVGGHISDYSNPHRVNKSQVGLSNVDNFPTANDTQSLDVESDNYFMTPRKVWLQIATRVMTPLTGHISASGNVHNLSKNDIGLDRVENIGKATDPELENNDFDEGYTTVRGVKRMFDRLFGNAFQSHVQARNPHGTGKSDIGLGEVANLPIATAAEALAGTSEGYSTPETVALQIEANAGGVAEVVVYSEQNRSFSLDDVGKYIRITSATDGQYTVPSDGSVSWPDHCELNIRNAGPGVITLIGIDSVVLVPPSTGTPRLAPNMSVTLKRVSDNLWDIIGQTIKVDDETSYNARIEVVRVTATIGNIVPSYDGKYLRVETAVASEYTLVADGSTPWPVDAEVILRKAGEGVLTIVPASGVVINPPAGGTLQLGDNMTVTIKRIDTNVFDLIGYTVAA